MTGIPRQSAASVLETPEYVRGLYERTGNDPRLLPFISPMAPFLDPGSRVFDDPASYGYQRLATTLEEHRQLLVQPSWHYIMNYESEAMSRAELVDSTYEAAVGINRVKAEVGAIPAEVAATTETRIGEARKTIAHIDRAMELPALERSAALDAVKREVDELNESTVCEKTELNWPAYTHPQTVLNVAALWVSEVTGAGPRRRKRAASSSPHPSAP